MPKKVLITSALPYANGPLHFGHIAGAYLPADCYARFMRLKGHDVLFICGSDEHGIAITLSAEMAKRSPKEHVDIFHKVNKDFFDTLGISFDHYSRTTWEGHAETTKEFFFDLLENGYVEEKVTDQLYSEEDDQFLADRYVVGTCPKCGFEEARGDECPKCAASYEATDLKNPRSKVTGASLKRKPTKHWFLRFDKFKEQLKNWLKTKNWKQNVLSFVEHYVDDLHPRAITRDSKWGIDVPLDNAEGKVFYVWFDAPIGYISACKEWAISQGNADLWKQYWYDDQTEFVNFIGKDNIPFHAIFFPAMIMGQNKPYQLVQDLPANEFYNLEGKQFSKSSGWYIDLEKFFSKYSADQIRYAIASNAPENSDSEFLWKDFQSRCNADLLGKYGNLANRVLTFIYARMGQVVPPCHELTEEDQKFLEEIKNLTNEIAICFSGYHVRKACALIMELATLGNVYFDKKQPWKLIKDEEKKVELETTLHLCLYCLKVLAVVSFPVIPTSAKKLWEMLAIQTPIDTIRWDDLIGDLPTPNAKLNKPQVLFRKIEDKEIEEEMEALQKTLKESLKKSGEDLVSFEDFTKLQFKVGKILEAEKVPKSSKLLKLTVDIGSEKRIIVSGIAKNYTPEELIEKKAIFLVNLKPAKLMGIESQGMLLCGSDDTILEIPFFSSLEPGATVS